MPCSSSAAVSRKSSQITEQAFTGSLAIGTKAYQRGTRAAENLSAWLEDRYGMSRNERLMIYGVALGAPLALFASPLVGLGLAGALAAPGLRDFFQRRRQQQSGITNSTAAGQQAVSAAVAPLAPVAHQVVNQQLGELQQQVAEQSETLQALIALCRRQQAQIDQLNGSPAAANKGTVSSTQAGGKVTKKQERQNPGKLQALLSLPAEESAALFSGQQDYLFRNGQLKISEQQRIAIYGKQPAKELQGTAVVEEIVSGSPEEVWEQVAADSPMEREQFLAACRQAMTKKSQTVSFVRLGNQQKLADPIPFKSSGLTSYDLNGVCYLKPQEHGRHQQVISKIMQQEKQNTAAA